MVEYLLVNCFSLFLKLLMPVLVGVAAGGAVSLLVQFFIHSEDRSVAFLCRYLGGVFGVYLAYAATSETLVQYATRLWSGLDLYK